MKKEDELRIYKNSISTLREVVRIQRYDGNWNYDPYTHGMTNGLILALSFFEEGDPVFLSPPKAWLRDTPVSVLRDSECETNN